ncbi:MAG TPA: M28 family peptidase [Methylomirabilota bacterium]|nr:M28 family peptidase [Methylomirabilota bacterium]
MTRRRPRPALAALLLALLLPLVTAAAAPSGLGAEDLLAHIRALTAPEMEGRGSGTPGGDRAARYIADVLARAGLRPGGEGGTFLQEFPVATIPSLGPGNRLEAAGAARPLEAGRDWTPHGGSLAGEVTGLVVLVGRDEYGRVDARDRIALALAGTPERPEAPSRLEQLIAARRAGARAVLLIGDELPAVAATASPVAIVSGSITRAAAAALLGRSPDALGTPALTSVSARLRVDLARSERRAANVMGVVPGVDPARADEAVVIGAHYDHLGVEAGTVYPGADDNASGTATVLALAQSLAASRPPRTLVFALFSGEEIGLVGSDYQVRHPSVVPVDRMAAMVNFDMVGRLEGRHLVVGGVDTGSGFRALVEGAAREVGIDVSLRPSGTGPSDHARFNGAGVPVLFVHSGTHADYHRPTDTADRIDASGMARIAALGRLVVTRLAEGPRPVFAQVPRGRTQKAAPEPTAPSPEHPAVGAMGGAFLGIAADTRAGWDGVRLGAVVSGSAAERAGLRAGDVLVRLGETALRSFPDLRALVDRHRPGDTLPLLYLRDGLDRSTTVTLGSRP